MSILNPNNKPFITLPDVLHALKTISTVKDAKQFRNEYIQYIVSHTLINKTDAPQKANDDIQNYITYLDDELKSKLTKLFNL
jgi:uncharacterized protein YaaR (DUF327 family)